MAYPRRRAALVAVALAALALSRPAPADAAPAGRHPYFDDQGTLTWYRGTDEARSAARSEGRLLFVEFGRRECGNCRVLVQRILPADGLRQRMGSLCVGLAAECDEPDPRIDALFARHLPGANALPFVAFVTADLEWVTGWTGTADAIALDRHLRVAEAQRPARPVAPQPVAPRPVAPPAALAVISPRLAPPTPSAPSPFPAARPAPPVATPVGPVASVKPVVAAPARPAAPPPTPPSPPAARLPVAPSACAPQVGSPVAPSDLLPRARAASAAGRHAEALALWAQARGRPGAGSADAWAPVVARADVWAEDCLRAAVLAAREGRWSDAAERLAAVRRETPERPAARDAAVGERAIARLRDLGGPAGLTSGGTAAAAEFQGTRWSRVFLLR